MNDYGYKYGIRDWKNIAPRVGFTYNVGGSNDLVIRGGIGPVLRLAGVERHLQPAVLQPAGRRRRSSTTAAPTSSPTRPTASPPTRSSRGAVKLPAQSVRTIAPDFKAPYTWQSSIGFQKQINAVTGFDVDLTHWNEYRDTRTIDANLPYNPATGYNLANGAVPVRPNPAYGGVFQFVSDGRRDQTAISSSLTRRLKNNFQAGLTYTLMLEMKDNGTIGYGNAAGEQPVRLSRRRVGDVARTSSATPSALWGLMQLPWGIQHQRHLLLRVGQPVQRQHRDGAVTASRAPTA